MKPISLCFLILILLTSSAYGVEVSGEISGVWTADDSPYIVVGDIVVNEDDSLVVMPGAEVRFDGNFRIYVQGWLQITGTEEDSVLITTNADEPEKGDWRDIYVHDDTPVRPFITYAIFEYGITGLRVPFGEVNHSTFRHCAAFGISASAGEVLDDVYIHQNQFIDNGSEEYRGESAAIITVAQAWGTIDYNMFAGNIVGIGIYTDWLDRDHMTEVINNTFVNNEVGFTDAFGPPGCFMNNILIDCGDAIGFTGFNILNNNSFNNDRNYPRWGNEGGIMNQINANGIPCDRYGNMSVDPGFAGGDPFSWELHPNSTCIDIGYPELPPDEDGTSRDLGAFPTSQEDDFGIVLEERWSIISLPLWTPVRRIELQIEPFIDMENLLMLKDDNGRFWMPAFNFSNLEPFDYHKGYLVKMDAREAFPDTGIFIPADEPIPLHEGWQMVAYYPEVELETPEAFRNIEEVLSIAKDDEGHFYLPERGFNNIPPLHRGAGYLVKVTEGVALIWNAE